MQVAHLPSAKEGVRDTLDACRRFERASPEIGRELEALLALDTARMAADMLDLADRTLSDVVPNYPRHHVDALRRRIAAGPRTEAPT